MEDTEKYRFLEPLNERETVSLVRDTATGSYSDLYIWSFLGLAFGVICMISMAN